MGSRIFISHAKRDIESVLRLAEDLKRAGLDVWLDEWDITVGQNIAHTVQKGLNEATYLAVWLTRSSVESGWVEREWQSKYGSEIATGSIIILPLLGEDCKIPLLLADKKYADFRGDYTKGLAELLRVVGLRDWENSFGMRFRFVLPGAFIMGSNAGDEHERPPHQAALGRPFYMANCVVTQGNWVELMGTRPWRENEHVREGDDYPAVNVTWFDAQDCASRLSELDERSSYYLPTEDEWEYAARAGTTTEFSFGNDERDMRVYGWYRDNTQNGEEYAHEVAKKRPNPWGLYDIQGNVWEWMDSWYYGSYAAQPKLNPVEKVLRGGGWDYPAFGARSAFRAHELPTRSKVSIGVRLVRRPVME